MSVNRRRRTPPRPILEIPHRRATDVEPIAAAWDVRLDLAGADVVALRDAIHLALQGPTRRAGDLERWTRLLARLGDTTRRPYHVPAP